MFDSKRLMAYFLRFLKQLIEQQQKFSFLLKKSSKIRNSKLRRQYLKMVLAHFSYAQILYPLQE